MTILFGRRYRLLFGQYGGTARVISGLRVSFSIEKSIDSDANTGTITIYNLNEQSRSEIEREGTVISLEAGYSDEIGLIFSGNDLRVSSTRRGVDMITQIQLGDGQKQLKGTTVNAKFQAGTSMKDIFSSIASQFDNLSINFQDIAKLGAKILSGDLTLSGAAKKAMDTVADSLDADWSIQDGEVRVIPKERLSGDTTVYLSPSSGLIGHAAKTEEGVMFTSLLNPRIQIGRGVEVSSRQVNGVYKPTKISHRGDSWSGDWVTQVECKDAKTLRV